MLRFRRLRWAAAVALVSGMTAIAGGAGGPVPRMLLARSLLRVS